MYLAPKDKQRFWNSIDVKGEDECWEWKLRVDKYGFGRFRMKSKTMVAQRMVYELENGDLLKNERVEHICGNNICCNPTHIQLTQKSLENRLQHQSARELAGIA